MQSNGQPLGRAQGAEREPRRQVLVREVNTQIVRLELHMSGADAARVALLCECGEETCTVRIDVARAEYEAARRAPTRFLLTPEHQRQDGSETVIARRRGYVVVETRA